MFLILKMSLTSTTNTGPLYIIIAVIAILSCILTLGLFLFSCIIKQNESKSIIMFLVINMLISNLFHVISYIINWVDSSEELKYNFESLCSLQSYIMISSSMSQEMWVATIAIIVFFTIKSHSLCGIIENNTKKTQILLILLFYIVPILLTLIFSLTGLLGKNSLYCWFNKEATISRWIVYGIRWGAIVISLFYSIQILRHVSSMNYEGDDRRIKKFGHKMILYPLIQLIGAIIPTIYRLYVCFVGESTSLQISTVVFGAIQGILYPLSYGWNAGLISFVVTGCKKGNVEEEDYDEDVDIADKSIKIME